MSDTSRVPDLSRNLCLFGASEHAIVVAEAAMLARLPLLGVWCQPGTTPPTGLPVLGTDTGLEESLGDWRATSVFHVAFVGAAGSSHRREFLAKWADPALGLEWASIIHPSAFVAPSATIGAGVFVGPRAVIHTGAVIREHAVINSAAIVEHGVTVGPGTHVATGAMIGGGARIGAWSFIGLGACIRDHITIGDGTIVAMGATVTRSLQADARVAGTPARPL
jgi:acetyltransferase EpsM